MIYLFVCSIDGICTQSKLIISYQLSVNTLCIFTYDAVLAFTSQVLQPSQPLLIGTGI